MPATRRRKPSSPPVATTNDMGPAIRMRDIAVPARTRVNADGIVEIVQAAYVREATVAQGTWPDPVNPERGFDVRGAISWLPLRMFRAGDLTKAQIIAASRYRDHLDVSEGCSDRAPGGQGSAPWARIGVTMTMLQSREAIAKADKALGRQTARTIRALVTLETLQAVALAIGVDRRRVPATVATALDELDQWWGS